MLHHQVMCSSTHRKGLTSHVRWDVVLSSSLSWDTSLFIGPSSVAFHSVRNHPGHEMPCIEEPSRRDIAWNSPGGLLGAGAPLESALRYDSTAPARTDTSTNVSTTVITMGSITL